MSRYIEVDIERGIIKETIESMDRCRCLCNDVCCNERSDQAWELVAEQCCLHCPHFEREDGIIPDI